MEALTSEDALCERLKAQIPKNARKFIGIDGMNNIGKTPLAHALAKRLNGIVISLDEYLIEKQGTYTEHIRCHDVLASVQAVALPLPIIIEGVCLRAVVERCGLAVHVHVYVRRISSCGIWYDEDICLAERSVEALKKREREIRAALPSKKDKDFEIADRETGLREELIDYHAKWMPARRADILFDVVAMQ